MKKFSWNFRIYNQHQQNIAIISRKLQNKGLERKNNKQHYYENILLKDTKSLYSTRIKKDKPKKWKDFKNPFLLDPLMKSSQGNGFEEQNHEEFFTKNNYELPTSLSQKTLRYMQRAIQYSFKRGKKQFKKKDLEHIQDPTYILQQQSGQKIQSRKHENDEMVRKQKQDINNTEINLSVQETLQYLSPYACCGYASSIDHCRNIIIKKKKKIGEQLYNNENILLNDDIKILHSSQQYTNEEEPSAITASNNNNNNTDTNYNTSDNTKTNNNPTVPSPLTFFIQYDKRLESIIVTFRGTLNFVDILNDTISWPAPFLHSYAHHGTIQQVYQMIPTQLNEQREVLCKYFGIKKTSKQEEQIYLNKNEQIFPPIIFVGHSMGAGIAQLLTLQYQYPRLPNLKDTSNNTINEREEQEQLIFAYKQRPLCIQYAPPQILSPKLAEISKNFSISVITGDDVIPRLSELSIAHLQLDLYKTIYNDGTLLSSINKILEEFLQRINGDEKRNIQENIMFLLSWGQNTMNKYIALEKVQHILREEFIKSIKYILPKTKEKNTLDTVSDIKVMVPPDNICHIERFVNNSEKKEEIKEKENENKTINDINKDKQYNDNDDDIWKQLYIYSKYAISFSYIRQKEQTKTLDNIINNTIKQDKNTLLDSETIKYHGIYKNNNEFNQIQISKDMQQDHFMNRYIFCQTCAIRKHQDYKKDILDRERSIKGSMDERLERFVSKVSVALEDCVRKNSNTTTQVVQKKKNM